MDSKDDRVGKIFISVFMGGGKGLCAYRYTYSFSNINAFSSIRTLIFEIAVIYFKLYAFCSNNSSS